MAALLKQINISFLNNGSNTHYFAASRTFSAINLTANFAAMTSLFELEVSSDLFGGDHFPVIVNPLFEAITETCWPRWVLTKADWQHYFECLSVENDTRSTI